MKETLEDRARAANLLSSAAWRTWGFPDLSAREAVRGGGRLSERYPTDYAGEVGAAADRFGVAPEWLWAVMRRESFFESAVVSGAGATGLLQLMEATARVTAEGHGLPAGPLQSPRVNVQLGAAHLHDLLAEEPGNWPVVLAAYNASLATARRWRLPGEDPDFYIEMIGYRETREYVRRVLEGYWIYRQLLRGE
jgi:soluble lytic murein transglycosylase